MKTIRNTKLFNELKKNPEWSTLFTTGNYPESKDDDIPVLAGGLDHIDVKESGVYFHDIGMSSGGRILDNSFVIRPELVK
uniref:Uncharacterized protein n=1 Tax=viral metagenome TaxID=1070528 RepID=A0A6M3XP27_9ZZZZ